MNKYLAFILLFCSLNSIAQTAPYDNNIYNPAIKTSTYRLSNKELKYVLQLLENANLDSLQTDYRIALSDQPTSFTSIYKGEKKYVIKDYGLKGPYLLQQLYGVVYKY